MNNLSFEWNKHKNDINQRRHRVDFEEASSVFFDEEGVLIHDPDHSRDEDRFLLLGISRKLRLLVVSHTYRNDDRTIRLISARVASPYEHAQYGRITRT